MNRKMLKRMTAAMVVLSLVATLTPETLSAASERGVLTVSESSGQGRAAVSSGECGENLTWELSGDGMLTIRGEGIMWNFSQGVPWRPECESVKAVVVEEGVTSIGDGAFAECINLTDVELPGSVTSIHDYAFCNCGSLGDIMLPEGIQTIGNYVFAGCGSLRNIVLPESLTSLGSHAFVDCKELAEITIPAGVEFIGADAFLGGHEEFVMHIVAGGNPFVERYAQQCGISYDIIGTDNISVSVSVVDENGTPLDHGFSVGWYLNGEMIGKGTSVSVAKDTEELTYRVEFEEELAFSYEQPDDQIVRLADGQEFVCRLRAVSSVSVAGKIADGDGNALPGTSLILSQFACGYTRDLELVTDADGNYAANIQNLPTKAEARADGFYRQSRTIISDKADGNVDCGTWNLIKLPDSKITLDLRVTEAAMKEESRYTTPLTNANGLEFTAYNKTKGRDIGNVALQYPHFILGNDEVDAGDEIVLTVADSRGMMTASAVNVILDEKKMGKATIELLMNGHFVADLQGNLPGLLMLFDSKGKFVSRKTVSSQMESDALPEGTYQAVFMQKTSLLSSVSDISGLSEFGLLEEKDYVRQTVDIQNGTVISLGDIKVPSLDESRLYYTDSQKTFLAAGKASVLAGDLVTVTAKYAMKEGQDSTHQTVSLEIPDGVQFVENSVVVNGKAANYTREGSGVSVSVGSEEATVKCFVVPERSGEWAIGGRLTFSTGKDTVVQPIGTAHFVAENMTITALGRTSRKTVNVNGKARAGSKITVFDNGIEVGTAKANAAGSWMLGFELIRPYSFTYHDVYAEIENKLYEHKLQTDTVTVLYDAFYMDVSKVTMYSSSGNYNHTDRVTVFDFVNPSKPVPYIWEPDMSYTFVIEFDGDAALAEDVVLNVFDKSGAYTGYDASFDKEKGVWIVSIPCRDVAYAPVNVGVDYSYEPQGEVDYSATSHPDAEEAIEEYVEYVHSTVESLLEVEQMEKTDGEGKFRCYLGGDKDIGWDLIVQMLDYHLFDKGNLEDQGFEKCETNGSARNSWYMRYMVYEDGVELIAVSKELQTAYSYSMPVDFGIEPLGGRADCRNTEGLTPPRAIVDFFESIPVPGPKFAPTQESVAWLDWKSWGREVDNRFSMAIKRDEQILKLMDLECMETGKPALSQKNLEEALALYGQANLLSRNTYADFQLEDIKWYGSITATFILTAITSVLSVAVGTAVTTIGGGPAVGVAAGFMVSAGITLSASAALKWLDQLSKHMGWKSLENALKFFDISGSQYWDMLEEGFSKVDMAYDRVEEYIILNYNCDSEPDPGDGSGNGEGSGGGNDGSGSGGDSSGGNDGSGSGGDSNGGNDGSGIGDGFGDSSSGNRGGLGNDGGKSPCPDNNPLIDPSGYVCEAVPSNRLEGVKTTIYCRTGELDEFGEPTDSQTETEWDAADFDQSNPLLTGADGSYAWDVPQGDWRVKYEKDGYKTAYSEWLPVPPPQTEVNVALESLAAPQVAYMNAYRDNVKITFTQYMDIASVSGETVTVETGGKVLAGTIAPYDAEPSFADASVSYARTFMFTPDVELQGEVKVSVKDAVNYAGTPMPASYEGRSTAAEEPKGIEASAEIDIDYNSDAQIEVWVAPKEAAQTGLTVTAVSAAPGIVSLGEGTASVTVPAGKDGKVSVPVHGSLPGSAAVTLTVDGTDIKKTVVVRVANTLAARQCEKVAASAASGSTVAKGTKISLSTATDGAQIYYTLDGTCPCTLGSASRKRYTEPIEINEDTFLIAYAVKKGWKDSPTARFMYYLKKDVPAGPGQPVKKPDTGSGKAPAPAKKTLKKGDVFKAKDGVLAYKVTKKAGKKSAGRAAVKGLAKKKTKKIKIPAKIKCPSTGETFQVVSVIKKAFKGNKTITSIMVGDSVQTIDASAFEGCKNLSSVTLGKNVKAIGGKAFYKCAKLKKITVKSQKLKKVGKNAVAGIHKKAAIKVPAKKKKAYQKLFGKKAGVKPTMKVTK